MTLTFELEAEIARGDRVFLARDFLDRVHAREGQFVEVHWALLINLDAQTTREPLVHSYAPRGLGHLHDPRVDVLQALFDGVALEGTSWDLCLRANRLRSFDAVVVEKLAEAPEDEFFLGRMHRFCRGSDPEDEPEEDDTPEDEPPPDPPELRGGESEGEEDEASDRAPRPPREPLPPYEEEVVFEPREGPDQNKCPNPQEENSLEQRLVELRNCYPIEALRQDRRRLGSVYHSWKPPEAYAIPCLQDLADLYHDEMTRLEGELESLDEQVRDLAASRPRGRARGASRGWRPDPFSFEREPFSLCPSDDGSLALLSDLYDQLLPNFHSKMFNVGLDETFDLGLGRSRERCEQLGKHRVYLDFLGRVDELVRGHGKRTLFWGDIVLEAPELVGDLPDDIVALEWGYEHDHPFAEHGRVFADSGREFWVCPGTSSWNSFTGRTDNALANLTAAARDGLAAGARGYLITDWGDFGHLQMHPISELGFAAGAGLAWNAGQADGDGGLSIADLLDRWTFDDSAGLGQVLADLGRIQESSGARPRNGGALFYSLLFAHQPLEHRRFTGLSPEGIEAVEAELDNVRSDLADAMIACPDAALIERELTWTIDVCEASAELLKQRLALPGSATVAEIPALPAQRLADRLTELEQRFVTLWLERDRSGGLFHSRQRFAVVRDLLLGTDQSRDDPGREA